MAGGRAKVDQGHQIVLKSAKNKNREMGSKGGIWNKRKVGGWERYKGSVKTA